MQKEQQPSKWEEELDKKFGDYLECAYEEIEDANLGDEIKNFIRTHLTAAEERGYDRGVNDSAGSYKIRLIPGERGVDNTA